MSAIVLSKLPYFIMLEIVILNNTLYAKLICEVRLFFIHTSSFTNKTTSLQMGGEGGLASSYEIPECVFIRNN